MALLFRFLPPCSCRRRDHFAKFLGFRQSSELPQCLQLCSLIACAGMCLAGRGRICREGECSGGSVVSNSQGDNIAGCRSHTRSIVHCVVNYLHDMPPEAGRISPGTLLLHFLSPFVWRMTVDHIFAFHNLCSKLSFSVLWLIHWTESWEWVDGIDSRWR